MIAAHGKAQKGQQMAGFVVPASAHDGSDKIERVPSKIPQEPEKWLGGEWMLGKDGAPRPVSGRVPNPKIERQFMAHDGDGEITLLHSYGHRPLSEAELSYPELGQEHPEDGKEERNTLWALLRRELKEIAFRFKDTSAGEVERRQNERKEEVLAAYGRLKARVDAKRAERDQVTDDAVLAQAREIEARRSKAKKGKDAS